MNRVTIDCTGIDTPRQLHKALAEALCFPGWYSCNLDALHDCLTSLPGETELTLLHFSSLPSFANGFRRVLADSQGENTKFSVVIL